jgi:two-component system phosphate regulon sensor histidine kinase PhoR
MNKYISIITILGLFILLFLQSVWLYNSYISTKKEIIIKISDVLENAINKETFFRLGTLPEGTIVQSRPESENGKNIPEFAYMQESLIQLGAPISLDSITFNYKQLLQEEGIYNEPSVYIIQGTKITKQIGEINKSIFNIETQYIPIRPDYSLVIAATLKNPETFIFKKMGVLLISTTILLIFVIYCLLLQIKMIFRLNKISQIREDFSYAMVHDMKTPLSTIMMVQDMLKSGRLDARPEIKNKYMSIAESETEHLFALTNKILTISKLENHKLEMNKTEVELIPIIEKLTEKFKAKAQKPVNFIIKLQAKTAYADNDYLGEVISNLIDNAIKYSKESVEINITAEESERYTILKVRDNGLGISEADQKVIFQKYERAAAAKRSRRNGASGFGLGLNFVDQIIKAHDGRIFVNSTEGEFTEFTIYLPLETPKNIHNR